MARPVDKIIVTSPLSLNLVPWLHTYGLDVASIDAALALGSGPPSDELRHQLETAYRRLLQLQSDRKVSREPWLLLTAAVARLLVEPPDSVIVSYINKQFIDAGMKMPNLLGLTPAGRAGLYLLLLRGIPPSTIQEFRGNAALGEIGGPNAVLEELLELYRLGVSRSYQALRPTRVDRKFLDRDRLRLISLDREVWHARWLALNGAPGRIRLDRSLTVDWSQLSARAAAFIATFREDLPLHFTHDNAYRQQHRANVDILVTPDGGGPGHVVEVKCATERVLVFTKSIIIAKTLLQIIRLGLVVKKNNLAGLELVLDAEEIDRRSLTQLIEALEITEVPYLIRFQRGERIVLIRNPERALSYQVFSQPLESGAASPRSLPFPPLANGPVDYRTLRTARPAAPTGPLTAIEFVHPVLDARTIGDMPGDLVLDEEVRRDRPGPDQAEVTTVPEGTGLELGMNPQGPAAGPLAPDLAAPELTDPTAALPASALLLRPCG